MEATVLNPTQMHLLKLFAFNNSEEYAREVQAVLTRHFQTLLDAEADRLWDEGIWYWSFTSSYSYETRSFSLTERELFS